MKILRSIELVSLLFLKTLPLIIMFASFFPDIAYGQDGIKGTETWLDSEQNIKILFSTMPAQPTIDTPSALRFTVQNLQTGKLVTNLSAQVRIFGGSSNQETPFQLTNISAPDGHFSINVMFPNIGSYQVITKITSQTHDVAALASFRVSVSALQSTSNLFGANYIIWISALIAAAASVASFLILKNPKYKDSEKGIDNRKNYDRYY
jgi:hypothetical protein